VAKQFNAGNAYLQILPSFRGIERLMQRETAKLAKEIDKSIAQGANDGLLRAFRNVDPDKVARSAKESGDRWASVFESSIGKRIKDAAESLPEFEPKVRLNRFDRAIKQTKQALSELADANIGPTGDVGLDQLGVRLDQIIGRMTRLADEAKHADQKLRLLSTASQAGLLKGLVDDAREQGLTDGRAYGGSFADSARKSVEGAFRSLPEINLDADTSSAERAVAALRAQLEDLGGKKIGVDIDRDRFQNELSFITTSLENLARSTRSVPLKFDIENALKSLHTFGDRVEDVVNPQMARAGEQGGEQWAGSYQDAVAARLQAAARIIPNLPLRADASEAEQEINKIRVAMERLSSKNIGVDLDADTAQEQIVVLRQRLAALDNDAVTIEVRTNALAAAAELKAITSAIDESSVSMQQLGRDAGITMSRLGYLIAIGASMGSLIAPGAATAALAVAGIGTAAASALIGMGAFAFGVAGIGDAVGKIDAYQKDAEKSARSFSQAQSRVTSALGQVRSAEQSLADARVDAADAAVQSQQRIEDAQRGVSRAQRDAAESVARARRNEKEAIEAVAEARVDARDAIRRAVESEEDAERSLTRANKDQKEARQELNEALRDAVQDLRELDTAVKRNGVEIQKATTESMKAKLELDKILTNPRATEIEKRMAREAYQDRIIQIEELKNRGIDLAKQQAAAAKDGVESTDRVKRAREGVATADERAADAARRLQNAREAVVKAQLEGVKKIQAAERRASEAQAATARAQADGAERVADAQRAVADAQKDAARQQRNSQRQIEAGTQRVADANRGLAQAYEGLGVAGGDAYDNMKDALDALSPAGRRFAQFLYSLKPALQQLRATAQEGLLPGLQDGIQLLVDTYLPSFDRFLGKITRGLGDMFRATAMVFTLPEWRSFFSFLSQEALPSLQGMWVAALNVARGVANLVQALNPLAKPIGAGLVDMTERFARWSDTLEQNPAFQEFLAYAKAEGPDVVRLIGNLVEFIGRLVIAMAPIGAALVSALNATFQWINAWDLDTLTAVVEVIAVLGTGILLLTGFVRAVKFVTEVWTATSLIAAKVQSGLAAAVARYNAATVTATASTGLLNGRLFVTQGAGLAGAAGMNAMTAAAGPLGVALAGIGAIWYLNYRQQKQANEATDELVGGFVELGKAYKTTAENADRSGTLIADTFKRVTESNGDMKETVVTLTGLGASLWDVAAAAGGSAVELEKVIDLIDRRIAQLRAEQKDNFFSIFDNEEREAEMERLYKLQERLREAAGEAKLTSQAMGILGQSTREMSTAAQLATPVELALADAAKTLGDESSTAQQKMDALVKVQDAIRNSAIEAIEAEESWNGSLISLRETVKSATAAGDKHSTSLGMNTSTGLRNRDMLENLINSANRMYDADVALNGVTDAAVAKGNRHIDQIRKLAKDLGLNKTKTDELINSYKKIPPKVETAIGFKKGEFEKMFQQLEMAAYIQKALKEGKDVDQAKKEYRQVINDRNRSKSLGWATGGEIAGPGIVGGKTEDANLIWASRGEFMQPAAAVDYYGPGFMEAVRQRRLPKEAFPGFAGGGAIGQQQRWNFPLSLAKVWVPSTEDIQGAMFGSLVAGALGGAPGGSGYRWQMGALRKVFPGLALYSGFRKGSRTANGSLSWHARDGGRAVDVPPRMDVFNWIRSNYGKNTRELIWGGAPNANIRNGKQHRFNETLLRQHGPYKGKPGPSPHIHWAYDSGGMLPPGYSTVFNGTGKPEPVLTQPQWEAVIKGGDGNTGPQYHYQIEFAENRLTLADLAAHERRQEALHRVGRAR
jgi:hypothetical protein